MMIKNRNSLNQSSHHSPPQCLNNDVEVFVIDDEPFLIPQSISFCKPPLQKSSSSSHNKRRECLPAIIVMMSHQKGDVVRYVNEIIIRCCWAAGLPAEGEKKSARGDLARRDWRLARWNINFSISLLSHREALCCLPRATNFNVYFSARVSE